MTLLRSQFMDALRVKGYSEKTVTSYVHCILDAVKLYRISPLLFTSDQIQKYLLVLIQQRKLAPGTVNLRINALKTFYKLMAPGSTVMAGFTQMKVPRHIPTVLLLPGTLLFSCANSGQSACRIKDLSTPADR